MKNIRIIPRLDIKGPNLVKGIHLEGLRAFGDPVEFARHYYEEGADEIIYMDVVASLYGRNSLRDFISRVSKISFVPMTVGGGIRTIDDIKMCLRAGADKVSLNTAVIGNPQLIREASRKFGSSTLVVAIEVIRQEGGEPYAFIENGREYSGKNAINWAQQVEQLGAGEILLTSVDREGTGEGFDLELINSIANATSIPIVAHGGAGSWKDVQHVIKCTDVSGVAISSILHYEAIKKLQFKSTSASEGNFDFLNSNRNFTKVQSIGLGELKRNLSASGINLRVDN